ncbi:MAG TPA: DUF1559 domain-containing protein, partial [Pirellulales bacterium]|nr:DUF1559 domain-containing protein [Pirellulales bacterium]
APPAYGAPAQRSSSAVILIVVLGGALVGALLCGGVLLALLLPAVQAAREAARRSQCTDNLKQIGLAMQSYADVYKEFPPAYIADADGKPMHSWRVLILPYLEQEALYKRYRFDEPWDGPNNSRLAAEMPPVFRCPSDPAPTNTTDYVAITGPGTMFDGEKSTNFGSIKDGTTNTLMVVESSHAAIPWMEPRDLDANQMSFTVNAPGNEISSNHPGVAVVLFADGHIATLSGSTSPQTVRALVTPSGGEPITGGF